MGCGQFAILGQFYKKLTSSDVTSVDIYEKFIENSLYNSELNKTTFKLRNQTYFQT